MDSFGAVMSGLKNNGMAIDIKRKTDDGHMVDARDNELASLGTKATVASTAGLLKKLQPAERLAWAIETKDEANTFYKEKKFREAMGKYVECLAASDFGSGAGDKTAGNVDVLIIPVLCNLAACCIQVEEWGKAVSFADQAILLRPLCQKAHFRKGIGFTHLGEYEMALNSFKAITSSSLSGDVVESDDSKDNDGTTTGLSNNATPSTDLSAADQQRLPALILQARRGLQQQKQQRLKQKESLARAFAKNSAAPEIVEIPFPKFDNDDNDSEILSQSEAVGTNVPATASPANKVNVARIPKQEVQLMTIYELIRFFIDAILSFLSRFTPFRKRKAD